MTGQAAVRRPVHGGYPGRVPSHPRYLGIFCAQCGHKMKRVDHPYGGDSWVYRCPNGHEHWIGK